MSKTFTKEDLDPPERSGRGRSASGLPPGATDYITPDGMKRLQQELAQLRGASEDQSSRIAEIEGILGSVTVMEPEEDSEGAVGFGARVTLRNDANVSRTYRILGVDEVDRDPDGISWISPLGRTLLAANIGDRITTEEMGVVKIVKVEYPPEA